jgi:uncharacterized alpha-E superfamily protein
MLSRVADSMFWMSRYIERAENIARFLDVNLHLTLDLGESIEQQWSPLVATTGDHEAFYKRYGLANRENVWQFLTFDHDSPNSVVSCLYAARENARTIRGSLPSEVWEELNKFYLFVRGANVAETAEQAGEFLSAVKRFSQLLVGVMESLMSRDEAWHFARMGRSIERADKTSRILDVKYFILLPTSNEVGTPLDVVQWSALLKSASALEMYRRVRGRITPENVVGFLMLDHNFPRSVRYCLHRAEESLRVVTGASPGTYRSTAERRVGRLRAEFEFTQPEDIIQIGLHEFIDSLQSKLNDLDAAIFEEFFAVLPVASAPVPAQTESSQSQTQGDSATE